MSDNDMIRRGDALQVLRDEIDLARIALPQAVPVLMADMRTIAALPADDRVAKLLEALRKADNELASAGYRLTQWPRPQITAAEADHTARIAAMIKGEG